MDLLDRLHRKLREAAGRRYPAASVPAFTVAELYQNLIPYRAVRSELGILELAEYEHALLRLLAGERGYLRIEAPQVREELEKELASPSPILGIYRDYAAVRVELPSVTEAPTVPERRPADVPTLPERPRSDAPVRGESPTPPLAAPPAAATSCFACRAPLPGEEGLRFCPLCGADQHEASCASCGQALKPDWNFCIRCGTARRSA